MRPEYHKGFFFAIKTKNPRLRPWKNLSPKFSATPFLELGYCVCAVQYCREEKNEKTINRDGCIQCVRLSMSVGGWEKERRHENCQFAAHPAQCRLHLPSSQIEQEPKGRPHVPHCSYTDNTVDTILKIICTQ